MNTRKRTIILILVVVTLIGFALAASAVALQTSVSITPTVGVSCPTPDETTIPICAPGAETTGTPGGLPTMEAPGLQAPPAGP